jgi:hypothetical protein
VAVAVLIALAAGLPAFAKGPSQAVVDGPGLSTPIALSEPGDPTIGPELADMVQKSGFLVGLWCRTCDRRLDHRPPGALGPRYTVTYTMAMDTAEGTRSSEVVQYVFPNAEPRPLTYMPAGQRFWGRTRTAGGWYVARSGLRRLFADLGVTNDATEVMPGVEGDEASRHRSGEWEGVLISISVAAVAAALAVILAFGRRRPSRSPGVRPRVRPRGS